MKSRCLIALAATLLGCAGPAPVRLAVPFDAATALARLAPGDNQIRGRIMAGLDGGALLTCANDIVSLVPVTDYARAWARAFYRLDDGRHGNLNAAYRLDSREPEPRFEGAEDFYAATRVTRCDEDGEFSFANVANGEFFVVARTRWLGRDHDYYDFMYGVQDAQMETGSVLERIRLNGKDAIDLQWSAPRPVLLGGEGLR